MKTRLLNLYAELMCRAIWAVRRVFPPSEGGDTEKNILHRDWEWVDMHHCENCKHKCQHTFIEWMPERVTTATCNHCAFEGTLS